MVQTWVALISSVGFSMGLKMVSLERAPLKTIVEVVYGLLSALMNPSEGKHYKKLGLTLYGPGKKSPKLHFLLL